MRVKIAANSYAFAVGKYDNRSPLVIDPVLLYSTYLGGVHDDNGQAITVDAAGNAYVVGYTASQNFPITANAYQTIRKALGTYTFDVFVTKVSPSGVLLYSTFVGGSQDDYGFNIRVDPQGYAYFVGQTLSSDYPTTAGAFQPKFNGCVDGLVTKLSPDGSSLIYSSYIGGSNKIGCLGGEFGDNLVEGLAIDTAGDAYLAGATGSPDFPVTPGAYQTKYPGGPSPTETFLAGFAAELSPDGSHLIYSTLLGSIGADIGNNGVTLAKNVALDSAGNAYVVGLSDAIPTTPGTFQTTSLGGFDAFVVKLNAAGSNAKCATLLGGSSYDEAQDVVLDSSNNIYLAGRTDSSDFPATLGAYVTKAPGGSQVFVARLSSDCKALDWASVVEPFQPNPGSLGQFFDLGAIGFARDPSTGDLFVGSDTADQHLATTPDAAQKSFGGGSYDGFLMELDSTASNLLYATYFGGTGDDGINSIALDAQGNVFMTGATTSSTGFPLTPDAFQSTFGGTTGQAVDGHDAFFAALGTGTSGTIGSIYPTSGGNVGSITLKITGSNLQTGATATLVFDINAPIKTPIWDNTIAAPVAGALAASPRPLNFGNRPVFGSSGVSPVEAITLSNPSGVPILVGNISTTSNFQIVNPQACQTLMNPGQSCTLRIRFAPNAVATYKGKLIIADNSTSSPQTVALQGAGVPGTLSFTPDSLAFGEIKVDKSSAAKPLKMTNITSAVASVMSVVASAGFVVSNDKCTGVTLMHNGNCTVDVAFNPTAPGKVSERLTVTTDSAKAQNVQLTGNGLP